MGILLRLLLLPLLLASCVEGLAPESLAVEKAACVAGDGLWTPFPELYPGSANLSKDDLGRFVCRRPVREAGNWCADTSDCGGHACLAPDGSRSGAKAVGVCAPYDWMPDNQLKIYNGVVPYPEETAELFPRKQAMLDEFRRNREKWRAQGIVSYGVTVREHACFCLHASYYGPNQLTVRNGKLVSAIYRGERRDGFRPGEQLLGQDALTTTIDGMFARLERIIMNFTDNADFEINYDPTYGFPTRAVFDRPDWEDEQWDTRFTDFTPQ